VVNTALRKGRSEGYLEIAKNLKKMGLPVAQIVEGTGLDLKTIESLQ
jgi:predicted transposase YdaD